MNDDTQSTMATCPYPYWSLYSSQQWEEYDEITRQNHITITTIFERVFKENPSLYSDDLPHSNSVLIDYPRLCLAVGDAEFPRFVQHQPDVFMLCLLLILHHLLLNPTQYHEFKPIPSMNLRLVIRLENYDRKVSLSSLRAPSMHTMVAIVGTVIRVSNIRPLLTHVTIFCQGCDSRWVVMCQDGIPIWPRQCRTLSCAMKRFSMDRDRTCTTDWQCLRLQALNDEFNVDADMAPPSTSRSGSMPESRDVEVFGDLVDQCVPGDTVMVVGIIRPRSISDSRLATNNNFHSKSAMKTNGFGRFKAAQLPIQAKPKAPLYDLYIEANYLQRKKTSSVCHFSQQSGKGEGKDVGRGENYKLSMDPSWSNMSELMSILQISQQPDLFVLIISSICPDIFGQSIVKAGLGLALFGGRNRPKLPRSDIHVLLVGDPGLGKSQLLVHVSQLAPRSIHVCGTYASPAGLTVSLHKGTRHDFILEAGALVLANQGITCIDELDKMSTHLDALLEAMEQQTVSVAKAGIVCNLPTRTAVIAAANPRNGHYQRNRTLRENITLSSALLSRFDLTFLLLDKANIQQDEKISEHIIGLHASRDTEKSVKRGINQDTARDAKKMKHGAVNPNGQASENPVGETSGHPMEDRMKPISLRERILSSCHLNPIPPALLNRYIAYARCYVEPQLTKEAKVILQEFYLRLRRKSEGYDGMPVTTRQLESMIRLSEARAKLELREYVTAQDARDVVEIMESSWKETRQEMDDEDVIFNGETQNMEKKNIGTKSKKTQIAQAFIKNLQETSRTTGQSEWDTTSLYQIAKKLQLVPVTSFQDFLEGLNIQGYLLRSKNHRWKLYGVN